MLEFVIGLLSIFTLRVLDLSLGTLRLMMVVRGQKLLAWVSGFLKSLIFIIVMRVILVDIGDWAKIIAYAAGFSTGVVVGMWLESRLALGYTRLRIISPRLGSKIADNLRQQGYGLTEIPATGKDGAVALINCSVPRRWTGRVIDIVMDIDPQAFVTAESVRSVQRGFWPT